MPDATTQPASSPPAPAASPTEGRQPIRVLCVDDLPDVTAVMRMILDAEPGVECVGCLSSANDLVEQARALEADLVLLDATMPGKDPFEAMRELSQRWPDVRTIIYSGWGGEDAEFIDAAIDAGAWGCISKNDPPQVMLQAVRAVASGDIYFACTR